MHDKWALDGGYVMYDCDEIVSVEGQAGVNEDYLGIQFVKIKLK